MTMIEKVARALCKAAHDSWDDLPESTKLMFMAAARAAIEATRDSLLPVMERPEVKQYMDSYSSNVAWWRAVFDAALSETP